MILGLLVQHLLKDEGDASHLAIKENKKNNST